MIIITSKLALETHFFKIHKPSPEIAHLLEIWFSHHIINCNTDSELSYLFLVPDASPWTYVLLMTTFDLHEWVQIVTLVFQFSFVPLVAQLGFDFVFLVH